MHVTLKAEFGVAAGNDSLASYRDQCVRIDDTIFSDRVLHSDPSVHCNTTVEISKAKDILKETGAEDIASSGGKSVSTHGVDTDRQATDRNRPSSVDSTRMEDERVNRKVIGGC
jgi:hypothetical protein